MSFLESHARLLRSRPLVVGTLTGRLPVPPQIKKSAAADIIEVRLDTFREAYQPSSEAAQFARRLLTDIKRKSHKPLLLTFRSPIERGGPVAKEEMIGVQERGAILHSVISLCALVDLEVRHYHLTERLTRFAHRHHVNAIHSFHDFSGPSKIPLLNNLRSLSRRINGDLFKAAVTPRTNHDLESFLKWGLTIERPRPVLIGMGKVGLPSRYIGFSFGSVLTYGHSGQSAAPGQVPVGELAKSIREIYG